MVKGSFLRSINLQLDVDHPERIDHFRPTSKSAELITSLLQQQLGQSVFVIAPYGSGKSIATAYLGHLIDNRLEAGEMLRQIEDRLSEVNPELATLSQQRRERRTQGLFVPLYGYVPSAPMALQDGILDAMRRAKLGRQARPITSLRADSASDIPRLIRTCSEKMAQSGRDRIVIVWDEFGRHLQGLVSDGRPEELDVLQYLAEVASRPSPVPVSLVLLLHRSLLGYATALPSGLRREWAKIEGRFETVQYLDDSTELYELIGSLVIENRTSDPGNTDFDRIAVRAQEVGLFPNVDVRRLALALASAYPLSPTVLFLLPRVAARVAQNERTIFSFLQWAPLDAPVPASAIYEYFRGDFRTDGGAGGTQRAWLEVESALGKVHAGSLEEEALKTAFLLGLGLSGERGHATHAQVAFALTSGGGSSNGLETLQALIERNLLVHRRHSDQVVVWHGTDVDLRGRLDDERKRGASDFRLAPFLARELPPPVWRPVEYNARVGVKRYCKAEYTTVDGFASFVDELQLSGGWEPGTDGFVLYVLPETEEESARAEAIARKIRDPRLFIALGPRVMALREAALDLWCLLRMQGDPELLNSDPIVNVELDHLTDDARTALQPLADRVLCPQRHGAHWFYLGQRVDLPSVAGLRRFLSESMDAVFPLTPEIHSEMVVRRTPSPILVNARKKVALGILERCGQEDIGIEGNFADRAIFRCVFLRSGLYRRDGETWRLADPEELDGEGLRAVWAEIRDFFTEHGTAKSIRSLLDRLKEPPYGVREGLLPLLLAAGFKAFPTATTVRRRGRFIDDLLPSVIEDMAKNPNDYVLDVVGLTKNQEVYLTGLLDLFNPGDHLGEEGDILRACMAAVLAWRHSLPPGVRNSRYISQEARAFEAKLRVADPVALFLETLPHLVGATAAEPVRLIDGVKSLKRELDGVRMVFRDEAVQALVQALEARGVSDDGNGSYGTGVRHQASRWASYFPTSFTRHLPDQVAKGVMNRLRANYKDDDALVNALATLLVGLPVQHWDDATILNFRRQIRQVFDMIESTAVGLSRNSNVGPEIREGLARLTEARTWMVVGQLAQMLGNEAAASQLEMIATDLRRRDA